jgi:hypothetical protein
MICTSRNAFHEEDLKDTPFIDCRRNAEMMTTMNLKNNKVYIKTQKKIKEH